LRRIYDQVVLLASATTTERSVATLRDLGATVEVRAKDAAIFLTLGTIRRAALAHGLRLDAQHLHLCDWDRVIHWADTYPDELEDVAKEITLHDCLILGRTARAFETHPRVQRDTEAIINHCFGLAWGEAWDVTAASRGLSRLAAQRIVQACDEPSIGNDCVWPLFLRNYPDLAIGYRATEGLEWETPDSYAAEIVGAGGLAGWLASHDANLGYWVQRLDLAQIEIDALQRWT